MLLGLGTSNLSIVGQWQDISGRTLTIVVEVEAGQWDAAQRLWLLDGLLLGLLEGLCVGLGLQEVVVEA